MFDHITPFNFPQLEVIEKNGFRYYVSPNRILLPSVTTVLGATEHPTLKLWKKRVGEKESTKISKRAADRGNIIHSLAEKYLNNEKINKNDVMPWIWALFLQIKPFLDKMGTIYCLEQCLYSEILRIAGRVDCIGYFENKLIVIDFKGSTKPKKLEHIENYCCQATAYSLMFNEMHRNVGIVNSAISEAIIVIAVEQDVPQFFHISISDYSTRLLQLIQNFHIKHC